MFQESITRKKFNKQNETKLDKTWMGGIIPSSPFHHHTHNTIQQRKEKINVERAYTMMYRAFAQSVL
jgi:hypothetical protein